MKAHDLAAKLLAGPDLEVFVFNHDQWEVEPAGEPEIIEERSPICELKQNWRYPFKQDKDYIYIPSA